MCVRDRDTQREADRDTHRGRQRQTDRRTDRKEKGKKEEKKRKKGGGGGVTHSDTFPVSIAEEDDVSVHGFIRVQHHVLTGMHYRPPAAVVRHKAGPVVAISDTRPKEHTNNNSF